MNPTTILEDLYSANEWAWQRVFRLCEGLPDDELDAPREMGFGSLRATLFHVFAAEQIWLERWTGVAWRPLSTDSAGASPAQIAAGLQQVAGERKRLLDEERSTGWQRIVTYRDRQGTEHRKPLAELLLHVANHGVHHRAQVLNYLKGFGRTVPVGLDYLFYRLARPSVAQDEATVASLRGYGMEINSAPGVEVTWEPERVRRYFAYHDWANSRILESAALMNDTALDRPFDMGLGSIRKTLVHLQSVEPGWLKVWSEGSGTFDLSNPQLSVRDLQAFWSQAARQRDEFLARLDDAAAQRIVAIHFGGPPIKFRIIESLVQICVHGTHHRAQLLNMLRHSGATPPTLDYVAWVPNQKAE
jgi:uncharacterized damage-inducible protein DinB